MNKRHFFLITLIAIFCGFSTHGVYAQCTSFAGNVTPQNATICDGVADFQAPASSGSILDANDIKMYVLHTGTSTQLGTIITKTSATGLFEAEFQIPGTYQIAVVVANYLAGNNSINFNDPCLSFTHAGTLTVKESPQVTLTSSGYLTCASPTALVAATVSSSSSDLSYQWFGNGVQPLTNVTANATAGGDVWLTVTDNTLGCIGTDTVNIISLMNTNFSIYQSGTDSCTMQPATKILRCTSFNQINAYLWSTGETTASIEVPNTPTASNLTYCVTVTFPNACGTATACYTPPYYNGFSAAIDAYTDCFNNTTYLSANYFPFAVSYLWSNGSVNSTIQVFDPGNYTVTITNIDKGCTTVATHFLEFSNACGFVKGRVLADIDNTCSTTTGDINMEGITIELQDLNSDAKYFLVTDNEGNWSRGIPAGNYGITVHNPNEGIWLLCTDYLVKTVTNFDTTLVSDFLLKPLVTCSRLTVDVDVPFLRRCFDANYAIKYCNTGSENANSAYLDVQLDDFLIYLSSSLPATNIGNNTLRFQLGDIAVGQCGTLSLQVNASCDAVLGQSHCLSAEIYPHEPCGELLAEWSGASLQLNAVCDGDSLRFELENVGSASMSNALEYVVIEDAVMMKAVPPPTIILGQGQSHFENVAATGSTWRIEAVQEPNHPGNSHPSLSVEGCTTGSSFSTGFVTMFPSDDADYWKDIDCRQNIGSFDPNDKQGFPIGYGTKHIINRNTDIEYLIRFQNTGTDTAFTVVIRDTLSPWLDPLSVVLGTSSHPVRYDFFGEGPNIKFVFDNIHLPDSSKNLAGSQGFVSYTVSQKPNVPFGTQVNNNASIYFDFNEPIITNTTRHQVDTSFWLVSSWTPVWPEAQLKVSPNPMSDFATISIGGLPLGTVVSIEIMDSWGRILERGTTSDGTWTLQHHNLPSGFYTVKTSSKEGKSIGVAKIQVFRQ
jgi:uncharacterized repeat protein (TIGR01451 family)